MALINYWSDINIVCDRDMHLNAMAVRGVVEALSLRPHLYILNEEELVEQFFTGQFPPAAMTILCCHGTVVEGKGRILRQRTIGLEPGSKTKWVEKVIDISPEDIKKHRNIGAGVLVTMACGGATPELAEAFLAGGYSAYIAGTTGVAVSSSILFISGLLCHLMAHERDLDHDDEEPITYTLSEACERARGFEEYKCGTKVFKLFEKDTGI